MLEVMQSPNARPAFQGVTVTPEQVAWTSARMAIAVMSLEMGPTNCGLASDADIEFMRAHKSDIENMVKRKLEKP
jgi:hypothetical protein